MALEEMNDLPSSRIPVVSSSQVAPVWKRARSSHCRIGMNVDVSVTRGHLAGFEFENLEKMLCQKTKLWQWNRNLLPTLLKAVELLEELTW